MIRAKVVYTNEHMSQLYKCYGKFSLFIIIFCSVIILLGTAFELLTFLLFLISDTPIPSDLISLITLSLFLVILFIASNTWLFFLYPRIFLKNHRKKYGDIPIFYEFNENNMSIKHTGADFNENITITYDKLDKVKETKKYFLLYPQRYSVYIIGKHEITEGTPDDLRNLLKSKLGKKFK